MKSIIRIVDFGRGNLLSIARGIQKIGGEPRFARSAEEIRSAERLILPGVGAFHEGMRRLEEREMPGAIRSFAESGRPLLGICLGLQMLFDSSEEFGRHKGLGILPGEVLAVPTLCPDGTPHRIPHIGWNALLKPPHEPDWAGTILEGINPGTAAYFVHSFSARPRDGALRLADTDYDGFPIAAVVRHHNITGCQFHPEKSGEIGLCILQNFLTQPPTLR